MFGFWILLILIIIAVIIYYIPRKFDDYMQITCNQWDPIIYSEPSPIDFLAITPQVLGFLLEITVLVSQSNCPNITFSPPSGWDIIKKVTGAPNDQMYAYIIKNQTADTYIVSFTGTMLLNEWLRDVEFYQKDWPYGNDSAKYGIAKLYDGDHLERVRVHSGFLQIYESVRTSIMESVPNGSTVISSGISLGGGLSTLLAYDLATTRDLNLIHVSFASPRAGNPAFATQFGKFVNNSTRVYNTEDLVPKLPPAVFYGILYTHVGQSVPFTTNLGKIVKNHVQAYLEQYPEPVG